MKDVEEIERLGAKAVRELRKSRLKRGDFFMINVNSLPEDQCYLEFPDGMIKLVAHTPGAKDFIILRELKKEESLRLREKFDFELIH